MQLHRDLLILGLADALSMIVGDPFLAGHYFNLLNRRIPTIPVLAAVCFASFLAHTDELVARLYCGLNKRYPTSGDAQSSARCFSEHRQRDDAKNLRQVSF